MSKARSFILVLLAAVNILLQMEINQLRDQRDRAMKGWRDVLTSCDQLRDVCVESQAIARAWRQSAVEAGVTQVPLVFSNATALFSTNAPPRDGIAVETPLKR